MDAKELRIQNTKEDKAIGEMLSSVPGKQLMTYLEETFDADNIVGVKVEDTYYNLGARGVVRFLKNLRDTARKE